MKTKLITVTLHPEARPVPAQTFDLTSAQYAAFVAVIAAGRVKDRDGMPYKARLSSATATDAPWKVTIHAGAAKALDGVGLIDVTSRQYVANEATVSPDAKHATEHSPGLRADVDRVVSRLIAAQTASRVERDVEVKS